MSAAMQVFLILAGTVVIAMAFCWSVIAWVDGWRVASKVVALSLLMLAVIGAAVYGWAALVLAVGS